MQLLNIFRMEAKYQLKSIVFWLFVTVVCLFAFSQFGLYQPGDLSAPQPGQERYGITANLTPAEEMEQIQLYLRRDISRRSTDRVVIFLNKEVKLDNDQVQAMKDLLRQLEEGRLNYQQFAEKAAALDDLLGGNTIYSEEQRKAYLHRPMTYQEAKEAFARRAEEDGLANAFGRLLADYLGITAGFFPLFIAAFLLGRDRRTRMEELIKVRKVNPIVYVGGKFLAVVTLLTLVYLLFALQPSWAFWKICSENGWPFHPFGFIKYILGWITPTLLFTVALGMAVAELTGSGLAAIPVQIILWFNSISTLKGDYSLDKYIIRFNTSTGYDLYLQSQHAIFLNRLFYVAIAGILVAITAWSWKRRSAERKRGLNVLGEFTRSTKI
ncbi:MAG: ABC transporter permease [Halanaerobium sp.]|nr:ABC transporter permease [Halanaerobium sp.]